MTVQIQTVDDQTEEESDRCGQHDAEHFIGPAESYERTIFDDDAECGGDNWTHQWRNEHTRHKQNHTILDQTKCRQSTAIKIIKRFSLVKNR